ncbi:hypothetical protein ABZ876_11750 [Streptomyces sp. NPDC046931]|uniref:hypothetical protein n=1 Tax=Streptomyces sp. NPDC046931 TaxID=3154806 RepID=UPI0033E74350
MQPGGDPNDERNLWVEPAGPGHKSGGGINNKKDPVETKLHTAGCGGKVTLAAAQKAIASDWTTALAKLGLNCPAGLAQTALRPSALAQVCGQGCPEETACVPRVWHPRSSRLRQVENPLVLRVVQLSLIDNNVGARCEVAIFGGDAEVERVG